MELESLVKIGDTLRLETWELYKKGRLLQVWQDPRDVREMSTSPKLTFGHGNTFFTCRLTAMKTRINTCLG